MVGVLVHSVEFFDLSRSLVVECVVRALVVEPDDVLDDGQLEL
jgi:hypothetical protein